MKKVLLISLFLIVSVFAFAQAKELKPQTTCPISDEKIDKKVFTDFQGQRAYFCCEKCKAKFVADPEKYMAKFEKEGVLLENVQKIDPVCGMKLGEKEIHVDYKGRRVYFCMDGCAKEFDKDPEKYLKKL